MKWTILEKIWHTVNLSRGIIYKKNIKYMFIKCSAVSNNQFIFQNICFTCNAKLSSSINIESLSRNFIISPYR